MEEITRQLNEKEYLEYIKQWKLENKELINSGKYRKIFLECLLSYRYGVNKSRYDWSNSIRNELYFIYDDIEGFISIKNYNKKKKDLFVIYNNNEFRIKTDGFKQCQLGAIVGKKTSKFKYKKGDVFKNNKRNITIIDMEYRPYYDEHGVIRQNYKYYKYKCNQCGFDKGWIVEADLKRGANCTVCCSSPNLLVEGINDIPTTKPNLIKYFQGGYDEAKLYTKCGGCNPNNKEGYIYPICPDCGRVSSKKIKILDIYSNDGFTCGCSDNIKYPNKFGYNLLEQLGVDFVTEYSPDWIKPKRYDFYFKLNNKEYILEMDGHFHDKYDTISGKTLEESKNIDTYKNKLANEHNIEIIRVNCSYPKTISRFDYIKINILHNKRLNELFDLSTVDWDTCGSFALNNVAKIACEYKKNNPNWTTRDISNRMKYSITTICKWLKQGNELGWCYYNSEEEENKNRLLIGKANRKQVEIFKNGISLGIFESSSELARQSEKLFGIKLDSRNISTVCIGKRKTHKGFTFKHLTEEQIQENAKLNQVI